MADAYKAKWILTSADENSDFQKIYEDSALIVENGKIEDIIPSTEVLDENFEKVTDFGNAIITPGFVDINANLQYYGVLDEDLDKSAVKKFFFDIKHFFCMIGVPVDFYSYKKAFVEKEYQSLSKSQKIILFKDALKKSLLCGTTCVVQVSKNDNLLKKHFEILNKTPLKTFLLFDMCSDSQKSSKKMFFKLKKVLNRLQKKSSDSMYFGFHPRSIWSVHKKLWRILGKFAKKNKMVLMTSFMETKEDSEWLKGGSSYLDELNSFYGNKKIKYNIGESPVEYLKDLKVLSENLIINGGYYLSNEEYSILNEFGVNISYSPTNNPDDIEKGEFITSDILMRYFPQKTALSKSFFNAIDSKNLMEEVKIFKAEIPLEEIIKYITLYPAKMLGLSKIIGSLEYNKHADFNVFCMDKKQKMLTDLRYKKYPDEVYILGRQVVKDGEIALN